MLFRLFREPAEPGVKVSKPTVNTAGTVIKEAEPDLQGWSQVFSGVELGFEVAGQDVERTRPSAKWQSQVFRRVELDVEG